MRISKMMNTSIVIQAKYKNWYFTEVGIKRTSKNKEILINNKVNAN